MQQVFKAEENMGSGQAIPFQTRTAPKGISNAPPTKKTIPEMPALKATLQCYQTGFWWTSNGSTRVIFQWQAWGGRLSPRDVGGGQFCCLSACKQRHPRNVTIVSVRFLLCSPLEMYITLRFAGMWTNHNGSSPHLNETHERSTSPGVWMRSNYLFL